MGHYLAGQVVGMAIGAVVMAFLPSIGRRIKAAWVKDSRAVAADVKKKL